MAFELMMHILVQIYSNDWPFVRCFPCLQRCQDLVVIVGKTDGFRRFASISTLFRPTKCRRQHIFRNVFFIPSRLLLGITGLYIPAKDLFSPHVLPVTRLRVGAIDVQDLPPIFDECIIFCGIHVYTSNFDFEGQITACAYMPLR